MILCSLRPLLALRPGLTSAAGSSLPSAAAKATARHRDSPLGRAPVSIAASAMSSSGRNPALNVLGTELQCCCTSPVTGFYRDGYCHTGPSDFGRHVVCAQVTAEFLAYTASRGNDLATPMPEYGFPGLKPGDRWCLCASRWQEALEAGCAPPVVLESCHEGALRVVDLEDLKSMAINTPDMN